MTAALAIAWTTVLEMRRQRLLLVPLIGFVISLLLLASTLLLDAGITELEPRDAEYLAWGMGTAASVAMAVYAVIVGASLIARELSAGTMLMLAARPIARWQVVLGRALGAGAFLLVALLVTCATYGPLVALLTGSTAPLEDPFLALEAGAPAVLLGLAIGLAFSVQGRATAAIGSAIGVSLFAWAVGSYVEDRAQEQHLRSYLVPELRERLEDRGRIVGPAATALVRAIPFGTLQARSEDRLDDLDPSYGPGHRADGSIDVMQGGHFATAAVAPAMPPDGADAPAGPVQPARLPSDPTPEALRCVEFGGASCLFGFRNAWTRTVLPPEPELDDGAGYLLALLAIPAWIGIAMLLLWRRRDLVS